MSFFLCAIEVPLWRSRVCGSTRCASVHSQRSKHGRRTCARCRNGSLQRQVCCVAHGKKDTRLNHDTNWGCDDWCRAFSKRNQFITGSSSMKLQTVGGDKKIISWWPHCPPIFISHTEEYSRHLNVLYSH